MRALTIGPLRTVGSTARCVRSAMIGAYLQPWAAGAFLRLPATELADRVVDLEDMWGPGGAELADDLAALDEPRRGTLFESELLAHPQPASAPGRAST